MIIFDFHSGYHFDIEDGVLHNIYKRPRYKIDDGALRVDRLDSTTKRTSIQIDALGNHVLLVDALALLKLSVFIIGEYRLKHPGKDSPSEEMQEKKLRSFFKNGGPDPEIWKAALRLVGRIVPETGEAEYFAEQAFNQHPLEFLNAMAQAEYGRRKHS